MPDPISSGSGSSAGRYTSATRDSSPVSDAAAAEFAALLGASSPAADADLRTTERQRDPFTPDDTEEDDQTEQPQRRPPPRRPADGDTVDERDSQSGDAQSDDESAAAGQPPEPALGDAILLGLTRAQPSQPVTPPAGQVHADLNRIIQQIADKILVTDPSQSGGLREVRIQLKESALPGTEVRILQQDGKLRVQFHTEDQRVLETLMKNQTGLQGVLNERLPRHDVIVEVAMDAGGDGQPQDGRSRQQRDLKAEAEEQDNR